MTDNLIKRLQDQADRRHGSVGALRSLEWKAADRIEAQEAEIARLREALREYVYETTHLSPQEEDGSHWCKISANCLNTVRAALTGSE